MANIGYIQVTRKCNQHCRFCSNPPNELILSAEEGRRNIEDLKNSGYTGVILTGGEPTLYDGLAELITYAKEAELHPRIITNGQKLADPHYFEHLIDAGLDHLHLSIHSYRSKVQDSLTQNEGSWNNLNRTLTLCNQYNISVNINTVINKYNADHLDETVRWITTNFPFIKHFVWNNLDPFMNRVDQNRDVIPAFQNFELSLYRAARLLESRGCTFRIERVPLCYMAEYAENSTETRKIVKTEKRTVHFLDERRTVNQDDFFYEKAPACKNCSLNSLCAGIYGGDKYYSYDEIYPLFLNTDTIINKITSNSNE